MRKLKILSLFDGGSATQCALKNLGFDEDDYTYYASEIDQYCIKVTQKNFPKTIQIGDVQKVNGHNFPDLDLLIGGSPCQGFSFSGKQLNFNDPRSKLFFEYARILKETKPRYFLLENVNMKQEYQDVISEHVSDAFGQEITPVKINSALVTGQNRVRLYWTNLPVNPLEDRNIFLRDILEQGVVKEEKGKKYMIFGGAIRGRYNEDGSISQRLEVRRDGKSNALTTVQKDNVVVSEVVYEKPYYKRYDNPKGVSIGYVGNSPKQATRVYSVEGKSQCLLALGGGQGAKTGLYEMPDTGYVRKLTPVETERLQGFPNNYSDCVSNSRRYQIMGNAFTVPIIENFLDYFKSEEMFDKMEGEYRAGFL